MLKHPSMEFAGWVVQLGHSRMPDVNPVGEWVSGRELDALLTSFFSTYHQHVNALFAQLHDRPHQQFHGDRRQQVFTERDSDDQLHNPLDQLVHIHVSSRLSTCCSARRSATTSSSGTTTICWRSE